MTKKGDIKCEAARMGESGGFFAKQETLVAQKSRKILGTQMRKRRLRRVGKEQKAF